MARLKQKKLAWKYLYTAITGCHRSDKAETVMKELDEAIKTGDLLAYVAEQQNSSTVKDLRESKTPSYPSSTSPTSLTWESNETYRGNPIILLIEDLDTFDNLDDMREIVAPLFGLGLHSKGTIAVIATINDLDMINIEKNRYSTRWMIDLAERGQPSNKVSTIKTAKLLEVTTQMAPD